MWIYWVDRARIMQVWARHRRRLVCFFMSGFAFLIVFKRFNSQVRLWMYQLPRRDPAEKCEPQLQLAFAKTHKTASSTLQNIIFRWGDNDKHEMSQHEKKLKKKLNHRFCPFYPQARRTTQFAVCLARDQPCFLLQASFSPFNDEVDNSKLCVAIIFEKTNVCSKLDSSLPDIFASHRWTIQNSKNKIYVILVVFCQTPIPLVFPCIPPANGTTRKWESCCRMQLSSRFWEIRSTASSQTLSTWDSSGTFGWTSTSSLEVRFFTSIF